MSIGLYRIGYILRGWTSRVTKGYKVEPPEIMTSPPLGYSGLRYCNRKSKVPQLRPLDPIGFRWCIVGESTHKKHGAVIHHHLDRVVSCLPRCRKWTYSAVFHQLTAGSRSMGNRHTSLGPKKSLLDYCASDHFSRAHRKDIMRIKIRKDLRKRFKQWCKKNDMIPERAANALLNSELEEMFQIIDGDDQAPSDKPQA